MTDPGAGHRAVPWTVSAMAFDSRRTQGCRTRGPRLGRLFPIGRNSSAFGLTVIRTVKTARLVIEANDDNGLPGQELMSGSEGG